MIEYIEIEGKQVPYKVGYLVFKNFKRERNLSPTQFEQMEMDDIAYLHFLAFQRGFEKHNKENPKSKVKEHFPEFSDFEEWLDEDFSRLNMLEEVFIKFLPDPAKEGDEGK